LQKTREKKVWTGTLCLCYGHRCSYCCYL
jgi:hypothetical protein